MEKNIIYNSHNINILELIYSILLKYDDNIENIIVFDIDWDDIYYSSTFYLDSNLCLTNYSDGIDYFEQGEEKVIYEKFDYKKYLKVYIENKYIFLKNILKKDFDIQINGNLEHEIIPGDYNDDGDEIKQEEQRYFFKIICSIDDLKTKLEDYLNTEIENKEFNYSIENIEESILNEFNEKGKNDIRISSKDLGDKLTSYNKHLYKYGTDEDLITIIYYNDVIELFLYKLYLEDKLESIEMNRDGKYKVKSKGIIGKSISDLNIENEIKLLDGKIVYFRDKYLFKRIEPRSEYEIPSSYFGFMNILVDNIGERVGYDDICKEINEDDISNGTYKGNFKKLLQNNGILINKEDIIKGKNKGYMLIKYLN